MYPSGFKLTRLVDAASEPLSLADAKNFLRGSPDSDDMLVIQCIRAARYVAENLNDRSFITTTWQMTLDYLPGGIYSGTGGGSPWSGSIPLALASYGFLSPGFNRYGNSNGAIQLPMPPLIAVQSIEYVDQGGNAVSLDVAPQAGNVIVSPGTPGTIYPGYGRFYPIAQFRPSAVNITYTAGYGPDATTTPPNVVMAMMMLVTHYYEHRSTQAEIPDAVMNLLNATGWGGYA